MPRQIRITGMSQDVIFFDEPVAGTRLTPEAERALAESSRLRGPVVYSDHYDIIRYRIPEDLILTEEALERQRRDFERYTREQRGEEFGPWKMVAHDRNGVITVECYRSSPTRYEAYRIDPVQSLGTGTVCYTHDSKQPMNGDPREEFETWALKELEKGIRVEKWPPF